MGISITIGGIFLYKSYAYYENEKEYNVIKGIIPDFSYDVKFAIEVDGTKKNNIPTTPKGTNQTKYYKVTATCDDGIKAEWDYNAWNLKVENITKGTKCKLAFNSTLTEADYQKYIEAGVSYRRNTYRGKDITSKLTDGTLYSEIKSGHFDDIFVGDYIISTNLTEKYTGKSNKVIWLIADLDNYMNIGGNPILTQHHVTIIPAIPLMKASMNSTDTAANGYAGSEMVTKTLPSVLSTYITPVFGDHVIQYNAYLTNKVENARVNRFGMTNSGASSDAGLYDRKLDLMSEINVYGTIVWSSSGFDIGKDNKQYAIFKLKPEFEYSYGAIQFTYSLKDVVNSTGFASASEDGSSSVSAASLSRGVRPRFLIG